MKKILRLSLYTCFVFSLMKSSMCIGQNSNRKKHNYELEAKNQVYAKNENDVKATIERFLTTSGNYNLAATDKIMANKASYTIHFSDGSLAFVKSDGISYVYGVPLLHNIDYFTLKKESDLWEIVNTSFTSTPVTSDKIDYNLMGFAKGYAQAWCSQKPDFVALFFAEDGSLTINNGKSSIGRTAIAKDAKSFMDAFPDLVVSMDSLITTSKGVEFHWTLTGTNTGLNGTGNKVKINGSELWQMDDNDLIKKSVGSFDAEDYNRQLK